MELGVFSVSLSVKDLGVSRSFYEKLGFESSGGDGEHYLIMVNGQAVIGLFQGMFEGNILTFNPGWSRPGAATDEDFMDVRVIAARLEEAGLELTTKSVDGESGPGHVVLMDPDGNPVLIDQHR